MEKQTAPANKDNLLSNINPRLNKGDLFMVFNSFFENKELLNPKCVFVEKNYFFQMNPEKTQIYFFLNGTVKTKRDNYPRFFTEEIAIGRSFSVDFAKKLISDSEILKKLFRDLKYSQSSYILKSIDLVYETNSGKILITGCSLSFSYLHPDL
jgi:metal-dependent hydrolase (beta-lactamase superfamily II)